MLNYGNLSDVEFEELCKDIMSERLGMKLRTFTRGRDSGIDICDDPVNPQIVIQVKHYFFSGYTALKSAMKKEKNKVERLKPGKYYICTSAGLSHENIKELYGLFCNYMDSSENIMDRNEIEAYIANNVGILDKHYKLWLSLPSASMLQKLLYRDADFDYEVFKSDVDQIQKLFVASDVYFEVIDRLIKDRIVILTGNPGTGKTTISKMAAVHMISQGYQFIFVSGSDIREIKSLLSRNREKKQMVLLDDCFGQRYIDMVQERGKELVSLIKYVRMDKSKILLMNSRISVFLEATHIYQEVDEVFIKNNWISEITIQIENVDIISKAKILYNHLFFRGIPAEYLQKIKEDRNYWKIVNHRNYNPRLIQRFTDKSVIEELSPEGYIEFIFEKLSNPEDIWKDEYTIKLQAEDRIFMNTLFSLTDTMVGSETHKRAYSARIKHCGFDTTKDIWLQSKHRLTGNMLRIASKEKEEMLSVANPSVNDYLEKYLMENHAETEEILETATEFAQFVRMDSEETKLRKKLVDRSILELCFNSDDEKRYCIFSLMSENSFRDEAYKTLVQGFIKNSKTEARNVDNPWILRMFLFFLLPENNAVYDTVQLVDNNTITELLKDKTFPDIVGFIKNSLDNGQKWLTDQFERVIKEQLEESVMEYIAGADINDYYDGDTASIIVMNSYDDDVFRYSFDYISAKQSVLDNASDNLYQEVEKYMIMLPESYSKIIDIDSFFEECLGMSLDDAEGIIDAVFEKDYDHDEGVFVPAHDKVSYNDAMEVDRIFR